MLSISVLVTSCVTFDESHAEEAQPISNRQPASADIARYRAVRRERKKASQRASSICRARRGGGGAVVVPWWSLPACVWTVTLWLALGERKRRPASSRQMTMQVK